MQILCTVDIRTRELYLEDVTIAAFDHLVDDVLFVIEPIDGFQLETSTIKIAAVGPLGEPHDYEIDPSTVTVDEETGNINFIWSIPVDVTAMPLTTFKISDIKKITFAVCAEIVSGDNLVKAWHSDDGAIKVKAHLEPESGGGEDPSETATNAQKIGQLQTDVAVINTQIGALGNGYPTPAGTVAEMTDESAVYLYTGSETGYTAGNWYFYNGTAWTSGGTYGGAVTDSTLSIEGVAADAKAVGDALSDADDRLTALESGGSGMSSTAKALLISLLRKALYSSEQSADISALEVALETGDPVFVTGVSISPTTGSIAYGESTLTIKATVTPSNATNKAVAWTSSNENVATVSAKGVVTAVSAGTATITATTMDGGFTATCAVTVTVENLIVESNITRGAYISRDTGSANNSESFDATDYMWLKPNTTYYAEGPYMENFYAFYNSSKTFVTSPPSEVTVTYENDRNGRRSRKGTITTGANGYYFRASIDVDCHYAPYVSLVPLV